MGYILLQTKKNNTNWTVVIVNVKCINIQLVSKESLLNDFLNLKLFHIVYVVFSVCSTTHTSIHLSSETASLNKGFKSKSPVRAHLLTKTFHITDEQVKEAEKLNNGR